MSTDFEKTIPEIIKILKEQGLDLTKEENKLKANDHLLFTRLQILDLGLEMVKLSEFFNNRFMDVVGKLQIIYQQLAEEDDKEMEDLKGILEDLEGFVSNVEPGKS